MKVSILGGGGRAQALAWTADKFGHEVYVVPGEPPSRGFVLDEPCRCSGGAASR